MFWDFFRLVPGFWLGGGGGAVRVGGGGGGMDEREDDTESESEGFVGGEVLDTAVFVVAFGPDTVF